MCQVFDRYACEHQLLSKDQLEQYQQVFLEVLMSINIQHLHLEFLPMAWTVWYITQMVGKLKEIMAKVLEFNCWSWTDANISILDLDAQMDLQSIF